VLFERDCARSEGLGALPCSQFDGTFLDAVTRHVVAPLAEHGIVVPHEDVIELRSAASGEEAADDTRRGREIRAALES
jgi:hypothetical protein